MAYKYGYVMNLDPIGTTSEKVTIGSEMHEMLAMAARKQDWDIYETAPVVAAYLAYKPLPPEEDIISVEEGYWVEIEGVPVRCTYDLVYRRGDTIVIRDYKTFGVAPTLDLDLDFQARFYIATAMRHFNTDNVEFEYEYIRQTLTHKNGTPWSAEEMYLNYPLVISAREAKGLWQETGWTVADIKYTIQSQGWYRSDRKGFGGCPSCFYKNICKAENQLGYLDEQTLALLSTPREPLVKD
jgi:hypothetical protein